MKMKVKGTAVAPLPAFVEERFGQPGLERWLESLSADSRAILLSPIYPGEWYPLDEAFLEPTQLVCDQFFGGDLRGAWSCGRFAAEHSLGGAYEMLVKLSSVNALVERASSIFGLYYEPSEMVVVRNDPNAAVVRITRFDDLRSVVEVRIGGWIERALELVGGDEVRVEITSSIAAGDASTEYDLRWK
jgi:hypothetical protein